MYGEWNATKISLFQGTPNKTTCIDEDSQLYCDKETTQFLDPNYEEPFRQLRMLQDKETYDKPVRDVVS